MTLAAQGSDCELDHSLTIFPTATKMRDESARAVQYVLALVSTDAAFEDASVGPEVYSFARIERACSKWPQSACKTRGARRPIGKKKKKSKAMTEARRNERAKCAAKVKERSDTRRRQARTTAAHGGRQR